MSFLLDTNVVSEIRKRRPERQCPDWYASVDPSGLFLSVLVLGEIRQGVERLRGKDPRQASALDSWLETLATDFAERLLPVTAEVAETWGRMNAERTLPAVDGLLAATAIAHDLVLVTRNVGEVAGTGARVLNPFDGD